MISCIDSNDYNKGCCLYMEYTFTDFYRNKVILSFKKQPFSKTPKHVWVIARYNGKWLLTKHKSRGIEFPGGKVENGETAEQAAIREVMEETGGVVHELHYIGQYFVSGKSGNIIKNVYFGEIDKLTEQENYYETEGPVLLDDFPEDMKTNEQFSFMMKDEVLPRCLKKVKEKFNI